MKKVDIVIIGMGRMGKTRYDAMRKHGGFKILALCDIRPETMKEYEESIYIDWKRCLDEIKPEAVVVCTVNKDIPAVVCYALKNGMHVFSEKPPGRNLSDAEMMMKEQMISGRVLKFGFNHRLHSSVIEAKALIDSNTLGDIVCIRGVYGKAGNPDFTNDWRNDPKVSGGGILLDQGIHMIDLMCYLTGSDLEVDYSVIDNLVWKEMQTEDSAVVIMRTNKNQLAILHSNAVQWKHKFDLEITCTNGYIVLDGLLTSTRSYGEERITYYKKDLETKTGRLGKPREFTMCFDEDDSWNLEMEEFYNSIVNGVELKNGTSCEAVRVMSIINDVYEFAKR